ncbi:phosphodiester glycosidase family protein [Synechococcus sp. H55.11]|uniref:phosphodiester glycosidase family protein n=1 Tax=Synechococcus sp. H55.11 TaxID=2967121 RepID=UPI0039C2279A
MPKTLAAVGATLLLLNSPVAPAQTLLDRQPVRVVQGIPLYQEEIWIGDDRIPVAIVVISLTAGQLRPIWANPASLVGLGELSSFGPEQGAVAAINGGFFNRNTRQPLGAIRRDGRWISSPILGRGVIAWSDGTAGQSVRFARLQMQAELRNDLGDRIPLVGINSGYILPGVAQYTPDWGSTYTTQTDGEMLLMVRQDQVQDILPAGLAGSLTVPIPPNGYVLAARGLEGALEAGKLIAGDRLKLSWTVDPPELAAYPHMLGAGPLLLLDGQVVLDAQLEGFQPLFRRQRAARSAIGQLDNGHLLWVTAGNAQENQGLTLLEMAQLMQQLGCRHALNLDGGNASTLVLGGETVNLQHRHPEQRTPRVHNGLGFFPSSSR